MRTFRLLWLIGSLALLAAACVPPAAPAPSAPTLALATGTPLPPSPTPEVITQTPAIPTLTPAAWEPAFYLVALEDAGQSGEEIGCGDSVIPVRIEAEPGADLTLLSVSGRPGQWRENLTAAEQEQRRIVQFGVQQAELDREIAEYRASLEAAVAGAATRRTPALAEGIIGAVNEDENSRRKNRPGPRGATLQGPSDSIEAGDTTETRPTFQEA